MAQHQAFYLLLSFHLALGDQVPAWCVAAAADLSHDWFSFLHTRSATPVVVQTDSAVNSFKCSHAILEKAPSAREKLPFSKVIIPGNETVPVAFTAGANGQAYSSIYSYVTTLGAAAYQLKVQCPSGVAQSPLLSSSTVETLLDAVACPKPLKGTRLNGAMYGLPPYVIRKPQPGQAPGIDNQIMATLASAMEFTYDLTYTSSWGTKIKNGTEWTGTIKMVYEGQAHFGMGHLAVVEARHRDVAFSTTLYPLELKLFSGAPAPLKAYMNILKPFPLFIWGIWFATVIAICITMLIIAIVSYKQEISQIPDLLLQLYSMNLSQCHSRFKLISPAGKTLQIFIMVFVFFMVAAFDCNLRAYIMAQDYEKAVDNDQDVLSLKRELWVPKQSYPYVLYVRSPNPVKKAIGQQIVKNNQVYQNPIPPELFKRTLNKETLLIFTESMAAVMLSKYNLYGSREIIGASFTGLIMAKDFAFTNEVNKKLSAMLESGLIQNAERRHLKAIKDDGKKKASAPRAYVIDHILGSLLVLGIGLPLSSLCFVFEIVCRSRKSDMRKLII